MKIIVTGGAGFIGSHVTDLLIDKDHEVFIIDNLSSGRFENINPKAKFIHADLIDFKKIEDIFSKENPEIVYHLAAQIDIRKSVEDPVKDAHINIISSINLLNLCVKYNVKHFIFSSTGGAIYGDTELIPTNESHHEQPLSPYGCAKLSIEKYLNFYNKVHNLKYTALRYSNVYGPRQNPKGEAGVISIFLDNMLKGKTSKIFGGIQSRDFIFVEDVARANLMALNDNKSETYNISSERLTDIIEIFTRLNRYFKSKYKPIYEEMKKGEIKKSCLSHNKAKQNLHWEPIVDLNEGLDRTYCWFVKNSH